MTFEEAKRTCIYMRSTMPRLLEVVEKYNYMVERIEYCSNRIVLGVVYNKFEDCLNINYIDIYESIRLHKVREGEHVGIPDEEDYSHLITHIEEGGDT